MSQHDFNIANQGFPATRADLNNALEALATQSSGATEPTTTYAYQNWYDTSTNLLKMRNADDDDWITLAFFDQTNDEWEVRTSVIQAVDSAGVVIKTDDGTTRLTVADDGSVVVGGTIQASNLSATGSTSNRNFIINGSMQVWQRGTSFPSGFGYGPDRFWYGNVASVNRDTDAPDGFPYSMKLVYGSTSMNVGQAIELPAPGIAGQFYAGQKITLSYYAKSASGGEAISVALNFRDTKFSGTNQVAIGSAVESVPATWTRITRTFTLPALNPTNNIIAFEIGSIDQDFYITGVQLELGETATPFEHRSYGQELALCQRYFQKVGSKFTGIVEGTTAFTIQVPFILSMRAAPAVTGNGGIFNARYSGGDTSITNPTLANVTASPENVWLQVISSGLVGGSVVIGRSQSFLGSLNFLSADAEL